MGKMVYAGFDVGSTTIKLVVIDRHEQILFKKYARHYSDIKQAIKELLHEATEVFHNQPIQLKITGSGGMALAEVLEISFIQEVIACTKTVERWIPETDVAIELGGEDAKITFFEGTLDQRMNGSCAGGTGAFIDQMATLLDTDPSGLNELAKTYQKIYPIASRCGVFAKSDVQPLINDGVRKEDIAASIFQAVVNQTITGLASGRKIKGNVALLGGPLNFSSELRQRFIETLKLTKDQVIFPDNSQYFVAIGAALDAKNEKQTSFHQLKKKLFSEQLQVLQPIHALEPLFENEEELATFRARHKKATVNQAILSNYQGSIFLGIDAGSTTTKAVAINPSGDVLWTFYDSNDGDPLKKTMDILLKLYQDMPEDVYISRAVSTGYGESLIKHALKIDQGEVETVCHYKAANHFQPGVDFILDIGGQDMKAMTIEDGVLTSIQLNEACSSGCGSFIETFAKSLNTTVEEFAEVALKAKAPVDLGSRCTVFMNSKVRQTQKEGASIADISAGLSISVIKNALYKVIKVKEPSQLGKRIVCQGGTFNNESVLRAFEKISKREVIRPNLAGLMGAFGAALIAYEQSEPEGVSTLLTAEEIENFSLTKKYARCMLCENRCALTISIFSDGRRFITGNRCEKGAKAQYPNVSSKVNLYNYKYKRLFDYQPIDKEEARGVVGLPRGLNMYEHYPLWFTFFTHLGFHVQVSRKSSKKIYESGIDSMPDDTVCFPAKMMHGHINQLIDQDPDFIFYPSINYEKQEDDSVVNNYNCPVVISYPSVIKNNIDSIIDQTVNYYTPHLNLMKPKHVHYVLHQILKDYRITLQEVKDAYQAGEQEIERYRQDIQKQGENLLKELAQTGEKAIVLAGRSYHIDPKINHGIANVLTQEGFHVLTEDSVSHLESVDHLRVINQWTYHSRLYAAARAVTKFDQLELVQLNSFGCGIDAITAEQVEEILRSEGKIYTQLKIDEVTNLGAARIRIRSLKAAIQKREGHAFKKIKQPVEKINFTKDKKATHTILLPLLSPIHQEGLIDEALRASGYNVVQLTDETGKQGIDQGLTYVNNDACFPAIITIGQLIDALKSGQYDLDHTSVLLTQTGGGCRASNYIPLLRKALKDAGFANIPVVPLTAGNKGTEKSGLNITLSLVKRLCLAMLYGDLFQKLVYQTRPYEKESGSVNQLHQKWIKRVQSNLKEAKLKRFNQHVKQIIKDFDQIQIYDQEKPKVGIVGEILVKYSPTANNDIVSLLEKEGAEVVSPELSGFINYTLYNMQWRADHLGFNKGKKWLSKLVIEILEQIEKPMNQALHNSIRFEPFESIYKVAEGAKTILSIGNHTGEGWYLTGEIVQFLKGDVNNVIIMQPFGCLPNHVVGRGMMKEIKRQHPKANLTAIDYDPGASLVNQLNRIRLMLSQTNTKPTKETVKQQTATIDSF
ncbi:acyl-CoA dehydratase activase-related protein [Amphibacillus indicireducens]|uniref:2-hydroxyacyl-CoA dehydratase n=1 Tax=Amphibacillus indicireducens TaxID=1076330 RepID=A0ABP7VZW2_9BACI